MRTVQIVALIVNWSFWITRSLFGNVGIIRDKEKSRFKMPPPKIISRTIVLPSCPIDEIFEIFKCVVPKGLFLIALFLKRNI